MLENLPVRHPNAAGRLLAQRLAGLEFPLQRWRRPGLDGRHRARNDRSWPCSVDVTNQAWRRFSTRIDAPGRQRASRSRPGRDDRTAPTSAPVQPGRDGLRRRIRTSAAAYAAARMRPRGPTDTEHPTGPSTMKYRQRRRREEVLMRCVRDEAMNRLEPAAERRCIPVQRGALR